MRSPPVSGLDEALDVADVHWVCHAFDVQPLKHTHRVLWLGSLGPLPGTCPTVVPVPDHPSPSVRLPTEQSSFGTPQP